MHEARSSAGRARSTAPISSAAGPRTSTAGRPWAMIFGPMSRCCRFPEVRVHRDFVSEYHGQDGPIPIRRRPDRAARRVRAFVEACLAAGHAADPDKNAPGPGASARPRAMSPTASGQTPLSAICAGARPAEPDRARRQPGPARAVRRAARSASRWSGMGSPSPMPPRGRALRGRHQVPHILMLSGVGAAGDLRRYGIAVVHDSPGVGQHGRTIHRCTSPSR